MRQIRNQLAHFRGRLDPIQYDVLLRARDWLASRPVEKAPTKPAAIAELPTDQVVKQTGGKYGRMENWLKAEANQARSDLEIQQTFSQLEELIDDKLAPSAQEHRAWWALEHVQDFVDNFQNRIKKLP